MKKTSKDVEEMMKKAKEEAKRIKDKARQEAREIKAGALKQAKEIKSKRKAHKEKKIKFLHTRVPEGLERRIRQKAEQQRVPVSVLIRNTLEDAF